MAWERRKGRRYFYQAVRRDGRVVKVYHGRGETAELAERLLTQNRLVRATETKSLRVAQEACRALDRIMKDLDLACRQLVETTLRAAGYRKTVNYEWRGAMTRTDPQPTDTTQVDPAEDVVEQPGQSPGSDPDSSQKLRESLDATPGAWERAGDLAAHAEREWLELIAGPQDVFKEALARKAEALRLEMAGPDPTPIERLLAGRIVANWLQVHYAEASCARLRDAPLRHAEFAQKRMDAAQRRYLAAIAALAGIRRLIAAAAPARIGLPALALVGDRESSATTQSTRSLKRSAS
jgi:hypothetical protein